MAPSVPASRASDKHAGLRILFKSFSVTSGPGAKTVGRRLPLEGFRQLCKALHLGLTPEQTSKAFLLAAGVRDVSKEWEGARRSVAKKLRAAGNLARIDDALSILPTASSDGRVSVADFERAMGLLRGRLDLTEGEVEVLVLRAKLHAGQQRLKHGEFLIDCCVPPPKETVQVSKRGAVVGGKLKKVGGTATAKKTSSEKPPTAGPLPAVSEEEEKPDKSHKLGESAPKNGSGDAPGNSSHQKTAAVDSAAPGEAKAEAGESKSEEGESKAATELTYRQVVAWFQTLPLAVRHRVEESDHTWLLSICPAAHVGGASAHKVSDAEREALRAREARAAETHARTAHFVKVFPGLSVLFSTYASPADHDEEDAKEVASHSKCL